MIDINDFIAQFENDPTFQQEVIDYMTAGYGSELMPKKVRYSPYEKIL